MIRTASEADAGYLPEENGHRVAWWAWGNEAAPALLLLHGGPGGGISDRLRLLFNPEEWRIVAMDQRGCGASTPHAGDSLTALDHNRTEDLISDAERLRNHLGITSWAVYGGSWGVTLAQLYALAHPDAIRGLLLVGVTQTETAQNDWLYGHIGQLLPAAFDAFQKAGGGAAPGHDLVEAYAGLLKDQDPAVAQAAADAWCAWEAAAINTDPRHKPAGRFADPRFRLCFARIVTHYFAANAWITRPWAEVSQALGDLPGEMVHSAMDLSAPLAVAWRMERDWPGGRLAVLPGALHSAVEPEVAAAARAAAGRLRARLL